MRLCSGWVCGCVVGVDVLWCGLFVWLVYLSEWVIVPLVVGL